MIIIYFLNRLDSTNFIAEHGRDRLLQIMKNLIKIKFYDRIKGYKEEGSYNE